MNSIFYAVSLSPLVDQPASATAPPARAPSQFETQQEASLRTLRQSWIDATPPGGHTAAYYRNDFNNYSPDGDFRMESGQVFQVFRYNSGPNQGKRFALPK